jgi:hypothetical protein
MTENVLLIVEKATPLLSVFIMGAVAVVSLCFMYRSRIDPFRCEVYSRLLDAFGAILEQAYRTLIYVNAHWKDRAETSFQTKLLDELEEFAVISFCKTPFLPKPVEDAATELLSLLNTLSQQPDAVSEEAIWPLFVNLQREIRDHVGLEAYKDDMLKELARIGTQRAKAKSRDEGAAKKDR